MTNGVFTGGGFKPAPGGRNDSEGTVTRGVPTPGLTPAQPGQEVSIGPSIAAEERLRERVATEGFDVEQVSPGTFRVVEPRPPTVVEQAVQMEPPAEIKPTARIVTERPEAREPTTQVITRPALGLARKKPTLATIPFAERPDVALEQITSGLERFREIGRERLRPLEKEPEFIDFFGKEIEVSRRIDLFPGPQAVVGIPVSFVAIPFGLSRLATRPARILSDPTLTFKQEGKDIAAGVGAEFKADPASLGERLIGGLLFGKVVGLGISKLQKPKITGVKVTRAKAIQIGKRTVTGEAQTQLDIAKGRRIFRAEASTEFLAESLKQPKAIATITRGDIKVTPIKISKTGLITPKGKPIISKFFDIGRTDPFKLTVTTLDETISKGTFRVTPKGIITKGKPITTPVPIETQTLSRLLLKAKKPGVITVGTRAITTAVSPGIDTTTFGANVIKVLSGKAPKEVIGKTLTKPRGIAKTLKVAPTIGKEIVKQGAVSKTLRATGPGKVGTTLKAIQAATPGLEVAKAVAVRTIPETTSPVITAVGGGIALTLASRKEQKRQAVTQKQIQEQVQKQFQKQIAISKTVTEQKQIAAQRQISALRFDFQQRPSTIQQQITRQIQIPKQTQEQIQFQLQPPKLKAPSIPRIPSIAIGEPLPPREVPTLIPFEFRREEDKKKKKKRILFQRSIIRINKTVDLGKLIRGNGKKKTTKKKKSRKAKSTKK